MRTASEALGAHGGAIEFKRKNGAKIYVQPLTLKIMSKYEKWLESKAIGTVMALKEVDAVLFREAFSSVSQDITKGMYAFGGEAAQESLSSPSGIAKLISLMVNVDEDVAIEIISQEGEAFKDVLNLAITQSLPDNENEQGNPQGEPKTE